MALATAVLGALLAALGSAPATHAARARMQPSGDTSRNTEHAATRPRAHAGAIQPTQPSDPASEVEAAVAALVADVQARMTEHHSYGEYVRSCAGRESDDEELAAKCRTMLSDIARYGSFLAQLPGRLHAGLPGVGALIARDGKDSMRKKLWRAAGESPDSVTRIVSLLVLSHEKDLRVTDSPSVDGNPYKDLSARTEYEAKLLAEFHRSWPPRTDEAVNEFHELGISPDRDFRRRRAALVALGHQDTAEELLDVIESIDDFTELRPDAVQALALCGLDCISGLENLVKTGGRPMRMAALEALQGVPDADVAKLRAMVLSNIPAKLDAEEQKLVDVEREIQAGSLK